jgi:hypothetical protein
MMVALLLYGYAVGLYSSRRIAKACMERVDFMAIVALQAPARFQHVIANRGHAVIGKTLLQCSQISPCVIGVRRPGAEITDTGWRWIGPTANRPDHGTRRQADEVAHRASSRLCAAGLPTLTCRRQAEKSLG